MEKRELKFYETPAVEVVEMEVSAPLLQESSNVGVDDGDFGRI